MKRDRSVFQVHLWVHLFEFTHRRVNFAPIRRRLLDRTIITGERIEESLKPAVAARVMRSATR